MFEKCLCRAGRSTLWEARSDYGRVVWCYAPIIATQSTAKWGGKNGAMTARGGLMDYDAVLEAVESGKISAAAFDVYDGETPYIRKKVERNSLESETFIKLLEKENVIYTAHMSFYTDTAIENMILTTFENLQEYEKTGHCSNEITAP